MSSPVHYQQTHFGEFERTDSEFVNIGSTDAIVSGLGREKLTVKEAAEYCQKLSKYMFTTEREKASTDEIRKAMETIQNIFERNLPLAPEETQNLQRGLIYLSLLEESTPDAKLAGLHSLVSIGKLYVSTSEDHQQYPQYLLRYDNICKVIIRDQKSNNQDQEAVLIFLRSLPETLQDKVLIEKLTDEQLLEMKLAVSYLMLDYITSHHELNLSDAIHAALFDINVSLETILKERSQAGQGITFNTSLKTAFSALTRSFETLYSTPERIGGSVQHVDGFFTSETHKEKLIAVTPNLYPIMNAIIDSANHTHRGLEFVGQHSVEDIQVTVYKAESAKTVVVIKGSDSYCAHWNPLQERPPEDGLMHGPIYNAAEKAKIALEHLMSTFQQSSSNRFDFKNAIFTGFGLDGGVAQYLAYQQTKVDVEANIVACCIGTAPYTDQRLGAAMLGQKRLYSLNFNLVGDSLTAPSTWSTTLTGSKNAYTSLCWPCIFPLRYHSWFFTDFTGHDPKIYRAAIDDATQQPLKMRAIYDQAKILANA